MPSPNLFLLNWHTAKKEIMVKYLPKFLSPFTVALRLLSLIDAIIELVLQPGFRSRSFFRWSRSRIPNNTGSRSLIFCPTPVSNRIILYITLLNWEFLLKWYNFFETFVETDISCCVPRFPLILTATFHSLYVKELESEILERPESEILERWSRDSESEILERSKLELESDILPPTPQPWL